jgi:hypothetical protein
MDVRALRALLLESFAAELYALYGYTHHVLARPSLTGTAALELFPHAG